MFQNFSIQASKEAALTATHILGIIIVALIIRLLSSILINKVVEKIEHRKTEELAQYRKRVKTLASLFTNAINVIIIVIAGLMILPELGINIMPIITSLGVIGLAVGFGTQTLVKDIVTGFFILFENQYNVGDKVKISAYEGIVSKMNLRTTILQQEDGKIIMIPNSQVSIVERHQ